MLVEERHSKNRRETEIDFREFFSSSQEVGSLARLGSAPPQALTVTVSRSGEINPTSTRPLMSWPTGTNIIFATIAFFGGFFCIFHLFNTAEPLRLIGLWPAEIRYQRPFGPPNQGATIDPFTYPAGHTSRSAASTLTGKSNATAKNTSTPALPPFSSSPTGGTPSPILPVRDFSPNLASPSAATAPKPATGESPSSKRTPAATASKNADSHRGARKSEPKLKASSRSDTAKTARTETSGQHNDSGRTELHRHQATLTPPRERVIIDMRNQVIQNLKPGSETGAPGMLAPHGFTPNVGMPFHSGLNASPLRH
jgi:hypothetical protein